MPNPRFMAYLTMDGAWSLGGSLYVAETKMALRLPTSIGQLILPLYSFSVALPSMSARTFSAATFDSKCATTPDFETGMSVASPMAYASSNPLTLMFPLSVGIPLFVSEAQVPDYL